MGEVNLVIHGKSYGITCDDGQESHILTLAKYIDSRMREIAATGGATNEAHLLVLTSIVLADEINEARKVAQTASQSTTRAVKQRVTEEEERQISEAIQHLASRIDSVAQRLQDLQ